MASALLIVHNVSSEASFSSVIASLLSCSCTILDVQRSAIFEGESVCLWAMIKVIYIDSAVCYELYYSETSLSRPSKK